MYFSDELNRILIFLTLLNYAIALNSDSTYATTHISSSECYDNYGQPRRCIPEFENAAFNLPIEATNTCGQEEDTEFCVQTGFSNFPKSCDVCREGDHTSDRLTDLHDPKNPTWWQSETIYEGIQYPTAVNLTLNLGKSFDITYIRIVFYSPRPESFAIYKRVNQDGSWIPYQFYSATCRGTYNLPDSLSIQRGENESRALCTSEYSDISPLQFGNIAFSSLEGRPSAYNFEHSIELQQWVTATDIRISLNRLNTFGDELFGDKQVLKSYFYAIADIAVGARCKCNGHANRCVESTGLHGERRKVCECKHYTDGPDCEKCLPFYNDTPWGRATSKNAHECKPCNCNGYSNKCYFDRTLYNLTGHGGHCIDCTANRDGPNCERCKENFYMRDDGYCIHCDCNPTGSRSLQCNSEGKCQCKKGVTGDKCDRCEANHFNFGIHGCQTCDCNPNGSYDNTPSCDSESGFCSCKENVEGRHCRECKPGFFNLDLDNRFGCTPCFCYGHTSECHSATGYSIVSLSSNFNKNKEKWSSIDDSNKVTDVKYNMLRQNIGILNSDNRVVYFNAPERFLGDQRASYNRLLKFKLQLVKQRAPNPSPSDIILEGSGIKIFIPIFAQGQGMPEDNLKEYAFRLHEHPDYSWQPSQSSRQFMSILSNLTSIKIRAFYSDDGEAYLDDFELQTAHRGAAGNPAKWIEQCQCPEGYVGQFCESCAPGYRHSPANGGPFMPCIPCDCNKHAEICDSETGRCICQHNTAGDNCDQCAKGYYGNALTGTPYDCKRCPCPDNGACMQLPDETVICLECPVGYFGPRCEICSDGYFGDPNGDITGKVQICQPCDCNGNIDANAVGNCNRTTGECLKCIHNTAGPHCDECLPGHFGDPFALPHGSCDACSCYPRGSLQTEDGISICNQVSGDCACKPNVIGKNCNECQNGFWNIASGDGCQSCKCDPIGSYNSSCNTYTGQCFCKPGVTGFQCDKCEADHYGFSAEGCKACECDASGSKSSQCDENGQCPCNANVEGRTCNRCKENKYDRNQGCLDCPACYNLVQEAVNDHRAELYSFKTVLQEISDNPTVIEDAEFEARLKALNEKVDIVLEDGKAATGGNEIPLNEKMDNLNDLLTDIELSLNDVVATHNNTRDNVDETGTKLDAVQFNVLQATNELDAALELIQTEGVTELERAKNRSQHIDQQSEQMSDISRNARKYAEDLEKNAENSKKAAKDAREKALSASDLAKNTVELQRSIGEKLKTKIIPDFPKEKKKIENLKKLTTESLNKAETVYDESLTLFANITGLQVPELELEPIKTNAKNLQADIAKISGDLDTALSVNNDMLSEFEENLELSHILIRRGEAQKDDAVDTLSHVMAAKDLAENAVKDGDDTLKKAKNTYNLLQSFSSEVHNSSKSAEIALQDVTNIKKQMEDTDKIIEDTEKILEECYNNAEKAKISAKEAQDRYATQSSKDSEAIKMNANDAKSEAQKLSSEAGNLRARIANTESRFGNLEDLAHKDDILSEAAKAKVGQAKTDTEEVQRKVQKSLDYIKSITNELDNMREISVTDLNELDKKLNNTEEELEKAKLTDRIESLRGIRNQQNGDIKKYKSEIALLEEEVENIKRISSALPQGCFKRTRLEP